MVVNQKDHENCKIQLLVVDIFHELKQNRKKSQWRSSNMCSWITNLLVCSWNPTNGEPNTIQQYVTTNLDNKSCEKCAD